MFTYKLVAQVNTFQNIIVRIFDIHSFTYMNHGCVPCRQLVDVCDPVDGRPFRELVQHPRNSKPDLTYHRGEPQTKGTIDRMCYSVMEKQTQNYESHDYNASVWCEFAGWNWKNT
jgi:hypothetical protein